MRNPWQELKSRLGPIQFLDLTRFDLADAHRELGKQVSEQVWRSLDRRLDIIKPERLSIKIKQARECWGSLKNRSKRHDVADPLRIAISDYMLCLEAWGEGMDLARFSNPHLTAEVAGGGSLAPYELALVLQHDTVGCQTGLYRFTSGGVQLWHTEEDVEWSSGSRFDSLRIAKFKFGTGSRANQLHTFIYPDLMPGAAFSWRDDGYVQAVDSLFLHNPPQIIGGMLANVACWLALRLENTVNTQDMLELLCPFFDGCAMNIIWLENQTVKAARYEFIADRVIKSCLKSDPGSFLFQVNYFSDRTDATLQSIESLPERPKRVMKKRVDRTVQALQNYHARADENGLKTGHFFRLITSRAGKEWAYANKDVKAHFLCQIEQDEMEIWLGAGPAGREDIPQKIIQKI